MESLLLDRLSTLSHPQRMAIFRLLVRRYPNAVPAGEIASALSLKASTTSVYLSALTRCGLIRQQREGNSLRYSLDMEAARAVVNGLFFDCCGGRPDICPPDLLDPIDLPTRTTDRKLNVLFLCTGNSARSIMAEVLLRHIAGDRFAAFSAGTNPYSEIHPATLALLHSKGLPTEGLRAKNIGEFQPPSAPGMDFVFTVCDRAANEDCPTWPGHPVSAHWGIPDPVLALGTQAEQQLAFQNAYGALHNRITAFAQLPLPTLDRLHLQQKVDQIGQPMEIL